MIETLIAEKWLALYTRSRHEKLVDRELAKKGIESFLPLRKIVRNWSDRKKIIEEPLFKSYLFVRAPKTGRLSVLNTPGAVRFVGRPSDPIEVAESELLTIRRFLDHDMPLSNGTFIVGRFPDTDAWSIQECR